MTTPQELERFGYMWAGDGPTAKLAETTIGYRVTMPEREIFINNFGAPNRDDWRCVIYDTIKDARQHHVCTNWHFPSHVAAYEHALEWQSDWLPRLRRFEWFKGHFAYAVDGLDDVESVVVELRPGYFVLRVIERNGHTNEYHDPEWRCPMDALTV